MNPAATAPNERPATRGRTRVRSASLSGARSPFPRAREEERYGIGTWASTGERDAREHLLSLLHAAPIPGDQLLSNLGLFLESKNLARLLFMDELFRRIVGVQGVVLELGTRWGQNAALFAALRGIHDPFNRHRRIVAFDTFEGFPELSAADGTAGLMKLGNLAVTPGYADFLREVLRTQESLAPLAHIEKFEIRAGDATRELPAYLVERPETIVALAYFDFDLYEPTRHCLEILRPRLVRGSVLAFDELNDPDSPGETLALMETFGLGNVRLQRPSYCSRVSFLVVE